MNGSALAAVGIASDIRGEGPARDYSPAVYVLTSDGSQIVLRVSEGTNPIRDIQLLAARVLGGDEPVVVGSAGARYHELMAPRRAQATILGCCALYVAIFGLLSLGAAVRDTLAERAREYELRTALGASSWRALHGTLGGLVRSLSAGASAGLVIGIATGVAAGALWPELRVVDVPALAICLLITVAGVFLALGSSVPQALRGGAQLLR